MSQQKQQHTQHGHRAQPLRHRHQHAARAAIGPDAKRYRQQQERQRLRGLQETRVARTRVQGEHGDERCCRETDLLGRLRDEIGPGKPLKHGRKMSAETEQRTQGSGKHGLTSSGEEIIVTASVSRRAPLLA